MKRFLALGLCLLLLGCMTACGDPAATTDTPSQYTPATVENNTYRSTFLGIGAQLPTHFTIYTTEQLEELNGFSLDTTSDAFREGVEKAQILYDLYASNNNGDAVDIQLENLEISKLQADTAAAYADLAVGELQKTLESMGYQEVSAAVIELSFAGQTHPAIRATAKIGQFTLYQTVVCVKVARYVARITAGSFNEETVTELLSAFYAL